MIFAVVYSPGPAWIEGKSIEDQPLENHVQYLETISITGLNQPMVFS